MLLLLLATDFNLIDKSTQEKSVLLTPLQRVSNTLIPEIKKHKKTIIETTKENTEKAKKRLEEKIKTE